MKILRYVALRILLALPAVWLIITMVFLLAHIVPGDPVQQMLGEGARAEDLTQLRHALGLDLSLPVQYEHYLTGVLRGNLGESFRYQRPVTKVILEHYPATLELAFIALLVCAAIGISAGILAAHKRGQPSRSRRKRPNSLRPLRPKFRARPSLNFSLLSNLRLAASLRPRRHLSSDSSSHNFRRSSSRNPNAHGPQLHDRRTLERLRPHRPRQRPLGKRSPISVTPFATR